MKDDLGTPSLTPQLLLQGYAAGIFPMAEHRNDPTVFWVDPKRRGVIPLDRFHISRSLSRRMRRADVSATMNTVFDEVLAACANRAETWINAPIAALYRSLHRNGQAHSLEIWYEDRLAGGVYGVALGGAFFGESMFSTERDGSKIALACLISHLQSCGFTLFDTQFVTPHLRSLGAVEITRAAYHDMLNHALRLPVRISAEPLASPQEVMQRRTQMS